MTEIAFVEKRIAGWGNYPLVDARLARVERYAELAEWAHRPCLARGLGRAYGDAAISLQGHTLLTTRLNRFLSFDPVSGLLCAEAGVSLDDILRVVMPQGWFLPVTPGTRYVTLGGAIASDVHGKNHHHVGSFSAFVKSLVLFTAHGPLRCSAEENAACFWATVGGMGMTGLIGEVELQLKPIQSVDMSVTHVPAANLTEIMALMRDPAQDDEYTVAWIDCLAQGESLGRSVLVRGHHIDGSLGPAPGAARLSMPMNLPSFCLNSHSVRAFNSLYYRWQSRKTAPHRVAIAPFFYPLDGIRDWPRLYGKGGFVQYQFVLPEDSAEAGIREVLARISEGGNASFLAVLKRFGARGEGLLSFPMPGFTLALDIPLRAGTLTLLDTLDTIVLAHGGRVYLAKDARMSASTLQQMYPRLGEWQSIRHQLDPHGLYVSALGQRLEMC